MRRSSHCASRKSRPAKAAKDLEGGTIALVALKSITEAAVRDWLRMNGADLTKIKFEMPYAEYGARAGAGDDRGGLRRAVPERR